MISHRNPNTGYALEAANWDPTPRVSRIAHIVKPTLHSMPGSCIRQQPRNVRGSNMFNWHCHASVVTIVTGSRAQRCLPEANIVKPGH
jgi:hypothetical protein